MLLLGLCYLLGHGSIDRSQHYNWVDQRTGASSLIYSNARPVVATYNTREMENSSASATVTTVDATAARDLIAAAGGHRYLDVRTEEELSKLGHLVEVDRSINVPYMFINPQGGRVKNAQFVEQVTSLFTKEEHVVVGCQSGKRSEQACVDLQAAGFKNMGGGYLAWLHHGFPVHHRTNQPPPRQEDA